ncbi:hypothetical protein PTKIN_Ptkin13bG0036000 [Pterospermum kingtungense]
MGEACTDFRSWEEEIFWTHFQCIHFSQFLRGDFIQRVEIPVKFAKNIKKKLPETVTLKGPSENDLLVFKFNGVSHFDVLMFDGGSLCEKASSYFVRRHTGFGTGYQTKRTMNENPDEIVHNSSLHGLESSAEKSTNKDMTPSRQTINSSDSNKKKRTVGSSSRSIHARKSLGGKELSTLAGEVKVKTALEQTSMDEDGFISHPASCTWPATPVEKTNVLLMAQEALTKEGFMVVMKPTHVGKRSYMAVPIAWMAKYLSKENEDVILCINERTWTTRFNYHKNRDCGGLCGGWRKFVNDNNLEQHDACVFEPVNAGEKPIILDVSIFRFLDSAVPLTQVRPALC